jgi:hypothetical protein
MTTVLNKNEDPNSVPEAQNLADPDIDGMSVSSWAGQ